MQAIKYLTVLLISLSFLSGCSWITPYHPPIEQGNIIQPQQVKQLHKGMSTHQVKHLLGEPVLKTPWKHHQMLYIYTYRAGTATNTHIKQRIIIGFKQHKVDHIQVSD